ncbi:hypothetical protein [Streptomyces sp. TR02-1]|uniref:hypothetical protein n=1 Tax=Streptomyces sp. TR02-1 TaxID=3385977 RepID=UPI0039A209C5
MARQAVYRYDEENNPIETAGWFEPEQAEVVEEANPMTAERFDELARKGRARRVVKETLYRTPEGRWVHRVRAHVGPDGNWVEDAARVDPRLGSRACRHRYVTEAEALAWLSTHARATDVARFFPEEPERGPGRPEIGQPVQVRLGNLLPLVDQWAADRGYSRAEAIRRLLLHGLGHAGGHP